MALKQAFAQNAVLRKERSEKFLNKRNIKINPHLPVIEDETEAKIKSPEETVKRAVTALFATQIAMDCLNPDADVKESAAFFGEMLARFGLLDEPTPEEKLFFALVNENASKPTAKYASDMSWRIEMVIPLLWACGIISDDLSYPDKESEYIEQARMIAACDNFDELMQKVNMRNPSKILDKADLLFRMDWACVDARLRGEIPSGNLNPDVVVEQHKGINWLIGAFDAENWDKVNPHT
ncbi:MAG: DUF4272 domain-containing protein [[Eubacterium] saphenum]|nr:DUF4272 domain-containing protein [[Eubacterium] saphenum]